MAQYTNDERQIVMLESTLWAIVNMLKDEYQEGHGFSGKVDKLFVDAQSLAREVREYNDQFETDD